MKMRCLTFSAVMLGLMVGTALGDDLPVWLAGSTQVGIAGPESDTVAITAMMLDNSSAATVINPNGSVTFMDGMMAMSGWEWTWESITLSQNPSVSFVGGFGNTSGSANDFVLGISTPIAPSLGKTLYGGSTNLTFGDADFDGSGGLSLNAALDPAYVGTIDGIGVLDLLGSLSLAPTFAGDTTQSAVDVQGLPGPTIAGPAANSSIGIVHSFNLSAGDQVTYNSTFQVVPEPGSVFGLLSLGIVFGIVRTRRLR